MKHNLIQLFSIPLFYSNIGELDADVKNVIKNFEYPDEAAGHDHTANKYILNDATLEVLAKQIDDAVQHFVHEVLQVNDNVKFGLENSWVNRHAKGEHNTLHWHSNAMLSGVYYVDSAEGAGDIVFQKSHLWNNLFHDTVRMSYKETNIHNTNEFFITPRAGDIVLFPSHLEHMVTPNITDIPRYSLAFNYFPRGHVGEGTSELRV